MKQRKYVGLFILMSILFLLSACQSIPNSNSSNGNQGNGLSNKEDEVMLNQRQIDILVSYNLPTEYDKLTLSQRSAIEAIETMLLQLENTYNESFQYVGYYAKSVAGEEHLVASCSIGEVTIYRSYLDGKYNYWDDYDEIANAPRYQEKIAEYVAETFEKSKFKVFSIVNEMSGNDNNIFRCVSATNYVFVDNSVGEEDFLKFVESYGNWLKEQSNGNATITKFYLVKDGELSNIYEFNYQEKILETIYKKKLVCSISTSGEINIF